MTERRGGYGEVWMNDPSLSFRCGVRTVGLKRNSGGQAGFYMMKAGMNFPPSYEEIRIRTVEDFNKLWDFLQSLK